MSDKDKPPPPCVFASERATCTRCCECPSNDTTPWYRQTWPWLLLLLPALAVIAGVITIGIALRHSDSSVNDDYVREGLALRRDNERDRAAAQAQISAELIIEAGGQIRLRLDSPRTTPPPQLTLRWLHSFDAGSDCETTLRLIDGFHRGDNCAGNGRFIVEVRDPDASWRLRGRLTLPLSQTLRLQP